MLRDPIPRLVRHVAVPASVGFFFHTMYNVVDTYFGGLLGTEALAALSISFPIFFIIIAFASGTGTGVAALVANEMGAGRRREAEVLTAQSLSFAVGLSIAVGAAGWWISPALFKLLGASGSYLEGALDYMRIIFAGTPFFVLANVLNAPLTAVGDTRTFRDTLLAGFVFNLVLDPLFVFGGFGVPPMGLRGVALATVLIQALICVYIARRAAATRLIRRPTMGWLRPRFEIQRQIAEQAVPASFNMLTVGAGIFVITWFVSRFGQAAVAGYGMATRVEQIVLLPGIGLNRAALALSGQNYGAGNLERVRASLRACLRYGAWLMVPGGLLLLSAAEPLMKFFTPDPAVIAVGVSYLRMAAFALWAYVALFCTVSTLQGIKRPHFAVGIGLTRQLILPVLLFPLLTTGLNLGLNGLWAGIFLINWGAVLFSLAYVHRRLKRG